MKEGLKKIIMDALWYSGKPTPLVFQKDLDKIMDRTAQAIIDRLEIDEGKLETIIFDYAYKYPTEMAYCINDSDIIKIIVEAKPIKLKESDK